MYSNSKAIKDVLKESYGSIKRVGLNPVKDMPQILDNDSYFSNYISGLAEGLNANLREEFMMLCENTRQTMITESYVTNYVPYQSLVFPILRMFFPRLIAKEAVTVKPMEKPEIVLAFLKAVATFPDSTTVNLPSVNSQVTQLPQTVNVVLSGTAPRTTPSNGIDLLATVPAELKPSSGAPAIERRIIINAFKSGSITATVDAYVNVNDGSFTTVVDYGTSIGTDTIHGYIDFKNGRLYATSDAGLTDSFQVSFTVSLESNLNQPEVSIKIERIPLSATRRSLRVRWSPEFEQDIKALFDLDVQSELVNWISQQISIDIDSSIINDLITYANAYGRNNLEFLRNKPANFLLGQKEWNAQIVTKFNEASALIYNDTYIGEGNIILMNPLDAQIVQSLDNYSVEGFFSGDMTVNIGGLSVGTLNGKYRILSSSVVPKDKIIMTIKPEDERASTYIWAPYVPLQIVPLPYGNIFSLSMISRNAAAMIRPQGVYMINLINN